MQGKGVAAGTPAPYANKEAWHPAPAQTLWQGIRVRARASGTQPLGPNKPGGPRQAGGASSGGTEMLSLTCHFAWNCCRGCSHCRHREPPSVCARECARGCMRSCWRCSSLTGPGATAPSPNRSRSPSPLTELRAPPSRLPPPPTPAPLPPFRPASPPSRRAVLTSA